MARKVTLDDDRVIDALLSEPTVTAAAQKLGCSRNTIYRRLGDPLFSLTFSEARDALHAERVLQMTRAAVEAVDCLVAVLHDDEAPVSVKLKAAALLLDKA